MVKPDTTASEVKLAGGASGAASAPSPKLMIVECEKCRDQVGMRTSDGRQYHINGEPEDEHKPVPVPRRAGSK